MGSWCTVLRASCYFGRLNESRLHREAAQHVKGHGLAWFEVRVSERHEMLRNEDSSTALNIEEDSEISVKMDDSFDRNQLLEVLAQARSVYRLGSVGLNQKLVAALLDATICCLDAPRPRRSSQSSDSR